MVFWKISILAAAGARCYSAVTLPWTLWFFDRGGSQAQGAGQGDVAGLCKAAALAEVEARGWSLNPGRYVSVAAREEDDFDFKERLEERNEELETPNAEARELEERISENVVKVLELE